MAVGGNPGVTLIASVGRGRAHDRDDWRARPELSRDLLDCTHDFVLKRGRRAQDRLTDLRHGNLIVGETGDAGRGR
jgi:hypothetical protein